MVFDPPLPEEKQQVIEQMGFGVLNKVYFRFVSVLEQAAGVVFEVVRAKRGMVRMVQSLSLHSKTDHHGL